MGMRPMTIIYTLLTAPLFVWGQEVRHSAIPGSALGDTIQLEDVTISVMPFRESAMEATGGIFVSDAGALGMDHQVTANELINLAPGIHMSAGTYTTQRLVIRGVGSRTPYNTNRIRAYLDDIPLTTGDGISTVEDLDPASVGSLEILKGPSSALYGSGLGGVVRLNSPYPKKDGLKLALAADFGSFNTGRYTGVVQFKNTRWAVSGGAGRSFTEGYRENSNYARNNGFMSARYFAARHTVSLTLSWVDLFARIPSSLNEDDFLNEPRKAAENWKTVRGFEKYTKWLAGINAASKLTGRLTNHLILFSAFSDPYESRPFNILDDRSASGGFREYLTWEIPLLQLSAGTEYFRERYRWQLYETDLGLQGELLSDHRETRQYTNLFALAHWRLHPRLIIDGGFNVNLLQYRLQTLFRADSTDQSGSYGYDPVFSPRLGMSFNHHSVHFVYASAGHGFSAPSLEETLLPEGMINTRLKPETGWNLEIGHRGLLLERRVAYDITAYTIFLKNLLVTERISEDIFTGANAGSARNTGLEVSLRFDLFPESMQPESNVSMMLGYTISGNRFTRFEDDGIDYSGNALPGVPQQQINALLSAKTGGLKASIHYLYTGSQWMNDANTQLYPGYQLVHFQVTWILEPERLPLTLEFYGGIRNLFDQHYATMIIVNAPSFGGSAPRYYYPGLPREFYVGLRMTCFGKQLRK
jgi:iron complex outermembrane receptor protein